MDNFAALSALDFLFRCDILSKRKNSVLNNNHFKERENNMLFTIISIAIMAAMVIAAAVTSFSPKKVEEKIELTYERKKWMNWIFALHGTRRRGFYYLDENGEVIR